MGMLDQLKHEFSLGVRSNGAEYYRRRVVHLLSDDPQRITALVSGTQRYAVNLVRNASTYHYDCTCPYFTTRDEPCKHIWATLMTADEKGLLRDPPAARDPHEEENWDGEDGDEAGDDPTTPQWAGLTPPKSKAHGEVRQDTRLPQWKQHLADVRRQMAEASYVESGAVIFPANTRLAYIVDAHATIVNAVGLVVDLATESLKPDGRWQLGRRWRLTGGQLARVPDPQDQQIVQMLQGAREDDAYYYYPTETGRRFVLPESALFSTFKLICQTGRCYLRSDPHHESTTPLVWDEGEPWELWLEFRDSPGGRKYEITASLRRDGETMPLGEPAVLLRGGIMVARDRVSRFNHFGAFEWVATLRSEVKFSVPKDEQDELIKELFALPSLPRLELPEDLRMEESRPGAKPRLLIKRPVKTVVMTDDKLLAEVSFDYGGHVVTHGPDNRMIYLPEQRKLVFRDPATERAAVGRLVTLGFRTTFDHATGFDSLAIPPKRLPRLVQQLVAEGWHVEAEGKLYRQPGQFKVEVRSGIDWFELRGDVRFDDQVVPLPKLLAAIRRGETSIALGDGTLGILPEEWLQKYGLLASLKSADEETYKFAKRQVGFLDALLSTMPEPVTDPAFAEARRELHEFKGIAPIDPPAGFTGLLREYQREGLGWMGFLQKFGFGGCLADDMGLGKTVQVLAMLEGRRTAREANTLTRPTPAVPGEGLDPAATGVVSPKTSLVVVPRSLVFNWMQEARKFTPGLKVLDHTHPQRIRSADPFATADIVLTTYGLLRRDAEYFKDFQFDYVVLDEAQAIKNNASESAKAARLLRADHRLALSGTPVQNHLGELWSLFDFLNPGMMGGSSILKSMGAATQKLDADSRSLLAKALRPFILRRTKEQVAKDLPEKLEQTLYCEMEPAQRKMYDELREYYRGKLLGRIEREGINKAKIEILEALLRLRQAACHPGLIDEKFADDPSAKLDALLPQVQEVLDEGHKVLVFSQFTSFLSLLRRKLEAEKITYEYLDGKTRDRQARVDRFQTDPDCKLFLISLKAGGLGLNLTAADYVFLLDPWWNPAVESQAIDRAHRIGQTRRVFAYRLIAKDTVEEKVLQLQQSKRELADAILSADNSLIAKLDVNDLQLLLS